MEQSVVDSAVEDMASSVADTVHQAMKHDHRVAIVASDLKIPLSHLSLNHRARVSLSPSLPERARKRESFVRGVVEARPSTPAAPAILTTCQPVMHVL